MDSSAEKKDFMAIFNLAFYKKRSSWKLAAKESTPTVPQHPKQPKAQNNNNDSQERPTNQSPNKNVKDECLSLTCEDDQVHEMGVAPDDDDGGYDDDVDGGEETESSDESTCSQDSVIEIKPQKDADEKMTEGPSGSVEMSVKSDEELDWAAEIANQSFDHVDEPPSWMRDYRQIEDLAESVEYCSRLSDIAEEDEDDMEDTCESFTDFDAGARDVPHSSEEEISDDMPIGCKWCPTATNADAIANLSGKQLSARVHVYARTLAALLRETAFRTKIQMYEDLEPVLAQFPAYPRGRGRGRQHRDTS